MALVQKRLMIGLVVKTRMARSTKLVYAIKVDDPDEGPFTIRSYSGWTYGDNYVSMGLRLTH